MFLEGEAAENVYDEEEFKLLTELKEVDRSSVTLLEMLLILYFA